MKTLHDPADTGTAHRCVRDLVMTEIRDRILAREFPAGSRLPAYEELARAYGTSTFTIHKALTPLVAEGLLERTPRLGTFVRDDDDAPEGVAAVPKTEKCIGVLLQNNLDDYAGSNLLDRLLLRRVQQQLEAAGTPNRVWICPRANEEDASPAGMVVDAYRSGKIRSLLVLDASPATQRALCAQAIPYIGAVGLNNNANVAVFDTRYFVERAVDELIDRGCRRLGVISHIRPPLPGEREIPGDTRFFQALRDVAAEGRVEMRPEWRVLGSSDFTPDKPETLGARTDGGPMFKQFGYQAFMRLWDRDDLPDGLIVFPDVVAQGVVMAMLKRRVEVPRQLRVVFHRNSDTERYAPFPVSFLTSDISQYASMLLRMARGEIHGPVWLSHQLETFNGYSSGRERPVD